MDRITVRSRPRVPAVECRSGASGPRLERHLSVLAGPAVPQRDAEDATELMRELTRRDERPAPASRGARVHLLAPLRRLRRTLFGGRD
ncbi:hypothetical protein [Streptomyces lonarensis]|uniref:Uncharacterized protein n=1 Tax=Streptomyces lonarensis TaxID=700599 RepID=A0A7X6D4D4_9ACTN|nr:hypothetical protein [Streptomyces lonarensis]NJQ07932.1 hypothetical protein [Streptomyces lonarensis]